MDVTETPSLKIFVGGEFLDFNGSFRGNIARLNADGSVDPAFEPGGGADGPVYAVDAMDDGRVVIGGYFEQFDYLPRARIARLSGSGLPDPTFTPGSGPNDSVYSIVVQGDGKLMVGGVFTSYNGTRRVGLTRLFPNGTVDTSFLDTAYNQFAGVVNDFGFEPPNYVNSLALQSDGNVMIGGSFYQVGGNFAAEINNNSAPYLFEDVNFVWTRGDKRPRSNIARLLGGYTPGPGNMSYVLNQNTVDESAPILSIPLRRYDGRLGTIAASSLGSDNVATNGVDFLATPFDVSWTEDVFSNEPISVGYVGEFYHLVTITNDTRIEGDEPFKLDLVNPSGSISLGGAGIGDFEIIPLGGALGVQESVGQITDNDFNKGVIAFSSATYYTAENTAFYLVNAVRTNGSVGLISVRWFAYDGTANYGADYTGVTSGTISFGSGETNKTIRIDLKDDFTVEPDEFINVVLTNATGGATIYGATSSATNNVTARLYLVDNDLLSGGLQTGKAYFTDTTFSARENAATAAVTVRRLGGNVGELRVSVAVSPGTAANGADYIGSTNSLVWVNGDITPKVVAIPLLNDNDVEGNETVNLQLVAPSPAGATGAVNTATLVIEEDDAPGALSFSQAVYDVDERGTNLTVTVVRTGGAGGTVSVDYQSGDQSAIAPGDYASISGTLTLGPGIVSTNFQVTVVDDLDAEGERSFGLSLLNFVGATAGTVTAAEVRIVDDESQGNLAGSLDPTFNPLAGSTNSINAVVRQPDGKIIVGGDFVTLNRTARNRLGRLNEDGTLDPTFVPRSGPNGIVNAMALQEDGRLVIGGFFTSYAGTNRSYIARLLSDGTLDGFFNPGSGADNPVHATVVYPDRRIAVGGAFTTMNGISRPGIALLETNGAVSASFNPGLSVAGTVFAIAIQPDGKLIVGGDFDTVGGVTRPNVARLNPDGSLDLAFDAGTGPDALVRTIAVQADGKILVGGSFTNVNGTARGYLARLNSDGSVDSTFMTAVEGGNGDVNSVVLQYDGKIVVAGEFSRFNGVTRNGLTRLNRNGKTDATINFGSGANAAVNAVMVQPDRKLVIVGRFTKYDGETRAYIARIHGGSIDGAGLIQFGNVSYEVLENSIEATVLVQRKGGTTGDVTVDYQTIDDTATAGLDFTATSGTLTFLESETFQSFTVQLIDDSIDEDIEYAGLVLTNPTGGASLGAIPNATLVVISDETGIGFNAAERSMKEFRWVQCSLP
ncbi:MAG: hypothetical protein IPK15_23810 [Verrucomicrobia bacterium]|nr:hypothetical protein [Verrucomicrobiota bacterium]